MKKISIIGTLVLILVAAGLYFFLKNRSYDLISPKRGPVVDAVYALGKVKTKRQYELKIGVLAVIDRLYVDEGDSVKKGQPLVKFSESSTFRAPFDGVVTEVNGDEGEAFSPSGVLLKIVDLKEKFVEVSLEQQGALRVAIGQSAKIVFESLRGEKHEGKVSALFSKNDEFLAQIEANELNSNILPGMTADIAIVVGENPNALLIPLRAINNGHVVVLRGGSQSKIPVRIGAIDGNWAEILDDSVKEEDQLVVGKR